jgi:hypothetical protein
MLVDCGEEDEARMLLLDARQTFQRMGARLELERLEKVAERISAA